MSYCSHCGAPAPIGAPACRFCGFALAPAAWGQPPAPPANDPFVVEIEQLLRRGNKLDAVKRYREKHDTGLVEAKDAIEAWEARLRGRR